MFYLVFLFINCKLKGKKKLINTPYNVSLERTILLRNSETVAKISETEIFTKKVIHIICNLSTEATTRMDSTSNL